MAVMTVRSKNQVTIPQAHLGAAGLEQGDPIQFKSLPDGGIGIYPYGRPKAHRTLGDLADEMARSFPGIEDIELELPPRRVESQREIEW
jgi:bifunctional DNA-binding transcriptional regulator/antitoxin component of YhaV-PrlF toxin-antitoxin module